jgi:altronate hydrolase
VQVLRIALQAYRTRGYNHRVSTIDLITLSEPETLRFEEAAVLLHPNDDVGVAKRALPAGTRLQRAEGGLTLSQLVPTGHKFALHAAAHGTPLRRYGQIIGFAKTTVNPGDHVHTHNLAVGALTLDYAFSSDIPHVDFVAADARRSFMGYRRADGRSGTRNYIAVISSVNCSAHTVRKIAHAFGPELLAAFPNVDGVIPIAHGFGCATRAGSDDYQLLQRTLAGIAVHPNIGGYILVGLGCETNQLSDLISNYQLAWRDAPAVRRIAGGQGGAPVATLPPPSVYIQDAGGVRKTVESGVAMVKDLLPIVNGYQREPMRRDMQPGARPGVRRTGPPWWQRRVGGDARGLRRRAHADAPCGVARGRRKADQKDPLVGEARRCARRRDRQQPERRQQSRRADDDF